MRTQKDLEKINRINTEVKRWLRYHGISHEDAGRRVGMKKNSVDVQLSCRAFSEARAEQWAKEFGFSKRFLLTGEGKVMDRQTSYQKIVAENDTLRAIVRSQKSINDKQKEIIRQYEELYGRLPEKVAVV